jgi:predicted  nucleic acid-binding Zn-ribbon protein
MDPSNASKAEALLLSHVRTFPAFQFTMRTENGLKNVDQQLPFTRSSSMPLVSKPSPDAVVVAKTAISRPQLQRLQSNPSIPSTPQRSRSQTLKGAIHLPKQTHLLRRKLDRILYNFHETVLEHDKSQQTRLQQLHMENEKLRSANQELEIENLKYFKEIEDCEEQMGILENQRQMLTEKMTTLRDQKSGQATLLEENRRMKAEIENLKKTNTHLNQENASMLNELNEYTDWFHQKESRVRELETELEQLKAKMENKENTIFSSLKSLQLR